MPLLRPVAALLLFALAGCSHVVVSPRPLVATTFPHEVSDLKPDPAVRWGRLPNGLRYAVLPHQAPRERASVFLLVQAGSYHERNHEQGYAHFVEHLAFRSLQGVPDGVFATVEKLGVGNSPHSNGVTGPFETQYRFDQIPLADPSVLPASLKILRAIADGIVFDPVGVTRERDVILNEMRTREGMMANARPDELEFLAPNEDELTGNEFGALFGPTRVGRRHPIGNKETLNAATVARLRTFYDRWYRPERMVLAVVGDVSAAEVDALIRETFGSLAARTSAPKDPPLEFPASRSYIRGSASDRSTEPFMKVGLGVVRSHLANDTAERRRQLLSRRIALDMLDRRYRRTARTASPPFLSAQALLNHLVPGAEAFVLRAEAHPRDWPKAVHALDLEPRRIWSQGFTSAEFELAVRAESNRTIAAARNAPSQSSATLAPTLAFSIARGVVFTSAEADRDLTTSQLASLTEKECRDAFLALLGRDEFMISLEGPFSEDVPKPETATATLRDSRNAPLTRYEPPPPQRPFPFTDFGPPGQVVQSSYSSVLDTEFLEFANGVRLNLKKTNFEPGRVSMALSLGGGQLSRPPDQPGLELKTFAWIGGGLRDLAPEELSAMLVDLSSTPNLSVGADEIRVTLRESNSQLPLLFQLATAQLVRPGFHDNPHPHQLAEQVTAPYYATAAGVADRVMLERMTDGHDALRRASLPELRQRTIDELKAWFVPLLTEAPLEIAVVGDFDRATVVDLASRTFGALPARRSAAALTDRRTLAFPPAPFTDTVVFQGNPSVGDVVLAWPLVDSDYATRFRATLIAKLIEQRLWRKFRVDSGEAYVMQAGLVTHGETFRPAGDYLTCRVEAAPEKLAALASQARDVVATLARDGATPDEFERARQPLIREVETGLRHNHWLLDMIATAQSKPAYAEGWARAQREYTSVTLDEINRLLARWLAPARTSQLIVKPNDS